MNLKITPVIRKTRTKVEEFEVCPHCQQEILEKSTYVDPDWFLYHRPCRDKGPIDKIESAKIEWGPDGIIRSLGDAIREAAGQPKPAPARKARITRIQWEEAGRKAGWLKTAQAGGPFSMSFSGTFEMNVAGKDYEFDYTATISDEHDDIKAERAEPTDMPDDL